MKGFPKHSGTKKGKKNGAPIAPKSKFDKDRNETIEYINDAEDHLEWLNEDLFNEKISKAEYDAKAKLLNMKIDAGRKAAGFDPSPTKNYKNPQDYKVFNYGNKPTPVKNKVVTTKGEEKKRAKIEDRKEKKIARAKKRAEKQHDKVTKRATRKIDRAYKRQEKKVGGPNIDEID